MIQPLAEHDLIRNQSFAARYAGGLPSGARIVVVLPQAMTTVPRSVPVPATGAPTPDDSALAAAIDRQALVKAAIETSMAFLRNHGLLVRADDDDDDDTSTSTSDRSETESLLFLLVKELGPGNVRCVLCGMQLVLSAAHIIPTSCFPPFLIDIDGVENGLVMCTFCHFTFDSHMWYISQEGKAVYRGSLLRGGNS
jgi:hypothetical protein